MAGQAELNEYCNPDAGVVRQVLNGHTGVLELLVFCGNCGRLTDSGRPMDAPSADWASMGWSPPEPLIVYAKMVVDDPTDQHLGGPWLGPGGT